MEDVGAGPVSEVDLACSWHVKQPRNGFLGRERGSGEGTSYKVHDAQKRFKGFELASNACYSIRLRRQCGGRMLHDVKRI